MLEEVKFSIGKIKKLKGLLLYMLIKQDNSLLTKKFTSWIKCFSSRSTVNVIPYNLGYINTDHADRRRFNYGKINIRKNSF